MIGKRLHGTIFWRKTVLNIREITVSKLKEYVKMLLKYEKQNIWSKYSFDLDISCQISSSH